MPPLSDADRARSERRAGNSLGDSNGLIARQPAASAGYAVAGPAPPVTRIETIITGIVVIMVLAVLLLVVTITMYVRVRRTIPRSTNSRDTIRDAFRTIVSTIRDFVRSSAENLEPWPGDSRELARRPRDRPAEGTATRPRKPLRRTAWGMLIGGLVGTALMVGAGTVAVLSAPPAGPHHKAIWPAGETMSITNIPFSRDARESNKSSSQCTVTPEGRPAELDWFSYSEPNSADFTGTATVTCLQPVALLTGTPRVVAYYTRSPLILVPVLTVILGILAFFPRLTYAWASFAATRARRPWWRR